MALEYYLLCRTHNDYVMLGNSSNNVWLDGESWESLRHHMIEEPLTKCIVELVYTLPEYAQSLVEEEPYE